MNRSLAVIAIFTLLLSAAVSGSAQEGNQQPWLWTPEQRIADRFNPQSIQTRLEKVGPQKHLQENAYVIDGRTNPELFFPWELMEQLLTMSITSTPSRLELKRRVWREQIETSGWNYDSFWSEIDTAAVDHTAAVLAFTDAKRLARRSGMDGNADTIRLGNEICRSRAAALNRVRQAFGRAEFDRFLYTAIAPGVRLWSVPSRDANTLRQVEGGCNE